jgi:ubiquinone/menaquinone biosynthesis C-methylase UbiE
MVEQRIKSELRNAWESAAPGWVKWEQEISAGLDGVTDILIETAGVRAGARVLDLACGGGRQTFQVAKRVGSSGGVVANDISGAMLEHVRRSAEQQGIKNIETLECAAEDLDKAQMPFDASICRLGVMLFPSPSEALSAVRDVLKQDARFAALVFTTPGRNPFMSDPMRILLQHAGRQPPAPGQPGIFALGKDGVLESLLESSGFSDVTTRIVRAPLSLPSVDDALEMMQQAFGAYRAVVADLSEAQRSNAWAEVRDSLRQFENGGRFETELEFVIGSGAK